ncbi:uncharacterized protein SCHCODRAFT_01170217 [Schizophyllum commune H4-8]|uniref:uncharacterized protein n=1 Tax=Schizophyllum commune (strain H4-8 / FGSC 9210) TaxID=578458 RepID=UPI00215F2B55|nr:uncharacterized protein SCHCODRAFT_01170217 [Schizophyllum commune H4-8]KAI5895968.1 hypothetical protein SCHCODRAFT_01170217 [Schizophyllum commune H4-8]
MSGQTLRTGGSASSWDLVGQRGVFAKDGEAPRINALNVLPAEPPPSPARPQRHRHSATRPSPLRPHVLARDRLAGWSTPHAQQTWTSLRAYFPEATILRWRTVALASVSEDTRQNYGAGLLRFTQFCDHYRAPEHLRMPASESLLAVFVAEMGAGKVQVGTIESWLSALALCHQINGAPWKGGDVLSRTRKGAAAVSALTLPRRRPRNPVSLEHMLALRRHLDLTNTFDSAVWAEACAARCGCCRLGEPLPRMGKPFDARYNMTRGTGKKNGVASNGHDWISLFVPYTKTKKFEGEWVPNDAPMFAYETSSGWSTLTKESWMARCVEIWDVCGLGSLLGHGFRIGGTTFLLLHGTELWIVMRQGRWSSKAFLRYWRQVEEILPQFIGNSLDNSKSLGSIARNPRLRDRDGCFHTLSHSSGPV